MIALMTRIALSAIAMTTNGKEAVMNNIVIKAPREQLTKIIETSCGLYAYKATLDLTKIGTKEYQENYATYYGMSRMDENWRTAYFNYMQKQVGNPNVTFKEILRQISSVAHKWGNGSRKTIDASFASKMLATLNSNYPILDSHVKKIVGIKSQFSTIEEGIERYNQLTEIVHAFLQTSDGANYVEEFDRMFPNFTDINPVKKIDLYLWKMGK